MIWEANKVINRAEHARRALALKTDLILLGQMLLLVLLCSGAKAARAQSAPDNRLEVALRTVAGQPASGVALNLSPRPGELGGPVGAPTYRSAVTSDAGWAVFDDVPGGIWLLSFAGSVDNTPLEDAAGQGQPPYGTNTPGGGFMVTVGELGDDIGSDDSGAAQSRVAQALFVGQARDGVWVPEYDLSDPGQTPQPLSLVTTIAPLVNPTPSSAAANSAATESPGPGAQETATTAAPAITDTPASAQAAPLNAAADTLQLTPLLLCYAPGLLVGAGLLGWAWLRRAQEGRG